MWLFLSRRIRMWLLLAVGLPLARTVLHRVSATVAHRSPDSAAARLLGRADAGLTALARRAQRRRR